MDALGQMLVTAVAAGVGAWLAAAFALNRYRRERAFDRAVDWYIGAIAVVGESIMACRMFAAALRTPDGSFSQELERWTASMRSLSATLAGGMVHGEMKLLKQLLKNDLGNPGGWIPDSEPDLRARRIEVAKRLGEDALKLTEFQADLIWYARQHMESPWVRIRRTGRAAWKAACAGARVLFGKDDERGARTP